MKRITRIFLFLLFAALPITLLAQNATTVAAYMKVKPGQDVAYLEVEQAWKKIHERGVELGLYNGWQLWQKLIWGTEDPYDYITLMWYNNIAQTFGENAPAGWQEALFTEEEAAELYAKTYASRDYVHETVSNLVTMAENSDGSNVKYMKIGRMRVKPGMTTQYVNMEREIFKPYFEELITRGQLDWWGLWNVFTYAEDEPRYFIVQGFENAEQLAGTFDDISSEELGLDVTTDEITELVEKTREMVSVEVWVLVDEVWAEEE